MMLKRVGQRFSPVVLLFEESNLNSKNGEVQRHQPLES